MVRAHPESEVIGLTNPKGLYRCWYSLMTSNEQAALFVY